MEVRLPPITIVLYNFCIFGDLLTTCYFFSSCIWNFLCIFWVLFECLLIVAIFLVLVVLVFRGLHISTQTSKMTNSSYFWISKQIPIERCCFSHQPDTALIWIYLCDAMNFPNPPNIAQNCQFCAILSQTADRQSIKRLKIAAEGAQSAPGLNMIWKIYCLVHPVFLVLKKYAKKYLLCHLSRMNIPKCHIYDRDWR